MSTHLPGFQPFFKFFLRHLSLAKLAASRLIVRVDIMMPRQGPIAYATSFQPGGRDCHSIKQPRLHGKAKEHQSRTAERVHARSNQKTSAAIFYNIFSIEAFSEKYFMEN